jgi:hypothetical protein
LICESFRDISLDNRSRILLPELNPTMTMMVRTPSNSTTLFVPNRSPAYLPVEQCNVTWNGTQAGVPYPTIVTEVG